MIPDANIHSWGDSAVQYLGREVGGDGYRPSEGDGGRASLYECSRYGGKEVMPSLWVSREANWMI